MSKSPSPAHVSIGMLEEVGEHDDAKETRVNPEPRIKPMKAMPLAAIIAASLASSGLAAQDSGTKAGMLTCRVDSGWGFIFGSSKELKCTFSGKPGVNDHYIGTVKKFGVDLGYTEATVIAWTVLAPTTDMSPGALAGTYSGATGSASVGGGVGGNVLFGGGPKSITLQPVSVEASTGLNAAGGIAVISLQPAG